MRRFTEGSRVIVDGRKIGTIVKILDKQKPTYFEVEYRDNTTEKVNISRLNLLYGSN